MGYNLKPSYPSVDDFTTRDRAISILYGRTPDTLGGGIVPIKVDASGSILIGTGISLSGEIDSLNKGIYDPTFVDPNPQAGANIIGIKRVGDATAIDSNLYAMLTQDTRMTFTAGSLNVSTTTGGTIYAAQTISVISPTYNTFSSAGIASANVRGLNSKSFVVLNTGAHQVLVRAFASVDAGVAYDVPILTSSTIPAGGTLWLDDNRAITNLVFQLQRDPSGDTTVTIKGFAQ